MFLIVPCLNQIFFFIFIPSVYIAKQYSSIDGSDGPKLTRKTIVELSTILIGMFECRE